MEGVGMSAVMFWKDREAQLKPPSEHYRTRSMATLGLRTDDATLLLYHTRLYVYQLPSVLVPVPYTDRCPDTHHTSYLKKTRLME